MGVGGVKDKKDNYEKGQYYFWGDIRLCGSGILCDAGNVFLIY